MKQCNECDNKNCGLIRSDYPKFRDDLPPRLKGKGHLECYAHVPVVDLGKGLGYLEDNAVFIGEDPHA